MDDTASALARAFVTRNICALHASRVVDESALLTSELVTNAFWFGIPPITMHISCEGSKGARIGVTDANPAPLATNSTGHNTSVMSGLVLVELLSSAWGVEVDDTAKTVWFRVAS